MDDRRLLSSALSAVVALLFAAAPAGAAEPKLGAAAYPGMTTYNCATDPITIYPGQNLNLYGLTQTCPHAEKVSGPGDAGVFAPGSTAEGYVTRFKPSMVEVHEDGSLTTPSVWDLHLHHVVWLGPGVGYGTGEEKTEWKMPQGYGFKVGGDENWGLNYMIHNLTTASGRQVQITWQIDWVPETSPARTDINALRSVGLDVAGRPQVYPVFDAERGFDSDGDGRFTFPDEVPTDPAAPGYEERPKISPAAQWTVPAGGRTLVWAVGHLHPGGLFMDMKVSRDGPDAGSTAGDDPAETKPLFRSKARYYEPAGAVSWDVAMTATRPEWRVSLKAGDVVSVNATYDVRKASWYESMGLFPLEVSTAADPLAKDPFDDAAAVEAMYEQGGILTHGRLPENVDKRAGKDLKLPDPRKLGSRGRRVPKTRDRDLGLPLRARGVLGQSRDHQGADAPAEGQARRPGHVRERRRIARDARPRAGLAQHHLVLGAVQQGSRNRLPAGAGPDQVRLRPARLRHRAQLRGDDPDRHLHDAAVDRARQDLHLLLPHTPVHARLDPGRGRRAQAPVAGRRAPSTLPGVQ